MNNHKIKYITGLILCICILSYCKINNKKNHSRASYFTSKDSVLHELYSKKRTINELNFLLNKAKKENDSIKIMMINKDLGKKHRFKSQYSKAIIYHRNSLQFAIKLKDTFQIVQAYNNLGTDFRRIGALDEASKNHYMALSYANEFSGKSTRNGKKNIVVAMNGIGNISLSLNYFTDAKHYLKSSLIIEKEIGSKLGQAVNAANLGAVYQLENNYDSAMYYFNKSMKFNKDINSKMGIGLCYIHIGSIYEAKKKYAEAEKEYLKAYNIMNDLSDKWHWLESCLALAGINIITNNFTKSYNFITKSENIANEIKSPEHIAQIYKLKSKYFSKIGNYKKALDFQLKGEAMSDSIISNKQMNRYIDMRLQHEQMLNNNKIAKLELTNQKEQRKKQTIINYTLLILFLVLAILSFVIYAYRLRIKRHQLLKKLENIRSDFFTKITHEFKTPLTVILGTSSLLAQNSELTKQQINIHLNSIIRQSNRLQNLINELLDLSKLKSGMYKPKWKHGRIDTYIYMIYETYETYANINGINLTYYNDNKSITGDFVPSFLDKIIANILSNALKHCERGDKVSLIIYKQNKNNQITFKISDTGEGISQKDIQHIFDLFYQSSETNAVGTGVGLSLTHQLIKNLNGKIEVNSTLGKGSEFIVTIPTVCKDKNVTIKLWKTENTNLNTSLINNVTNQIANIESQQSNNENKDIDESLTTILIVEDNKDIANYTASVLSGKYQTILADNGAKGIEMANKYVPDIIISDVIMPEMDGITMCRKIKESKLLNHIPIIILTAKTDEESRLIGLSEGADSYVNKPYKPNELLIRINNILESRKLLKQKYLEVSKSFSGKSTNNKIESNGDINIDFINKLNTIIHENIKNPLLNTVFIADRLHISSSQLNRKINAMFNYSSATYILHIKIDLAKKILSSKKIPIGEVAFECGFFDNAHFSRTFKKIVGMSPTNFQRKLSEK